MKGALRLVRHADRGLPDGAPQVGGLSQKPSVKSNRGQATA
jgi:hypothetical protein